jgi:LmbE family N-acetylglucosaminyl deacetylase
VKHVYLSPHLDDAVLSCGGTIHDLAAAGESVRVVTLFAGELEDRSPSAFALVQHNYWGNPSRPIALRRAEDAAALTLLGAGLHHLDFLDAVYRADAGGRWLYAGEELIFGLLHPGDPLLQDDLAVVREAITGLAGPEEGVMYAPLAAGNHVDHQLVRIAAGWLAAEGYRVAFYEDYPYAEQPGAVDAALARALPGHKGAARWQAETLGLDAKDLAVKVSALAYYRSQMAILFGGAEQMPNRIWRHAATQASGAGLAERLWWPADG